MITREDAYALVKENIKTPYLIKHMLAVEAIMIGLANHFDEDKERWGLVGLLHDLDLEVCDLSNHGSTTADMLKDKLDHELIEAIKSHNSDATGVIPSTRLQHAINAADKVSGIIVACALVMPDKKLASVSLETLNRKFKEKCFAKNCNRDKIKEACEGLGLETSKFLEISLKSMQDISSSLGL